MTKIPECAKNIVQQKGLISAILMVALIICLLSFFTEPVYAATTGNGRISGQLLNGTNQNAPVAGQTVTLQGAQGSNARDLATVTTDAHGTYTFTDLATDKTMSYAIYIKYQGAQYISDIVKLDSNPQGQANLTVYEATADSSNIAIVRVAILMQKPDPQKGTIRVSEILAFKNLDTRTFVGSLDATKGRPDALFFSLPPGVQNVKAEKGFTGYRAIQADRGFASDAAVLPGDNEFTFSFEIPYKTSSYEYRYAALYPTVELSLMVPPEMRVTGNGITPQGILTAGDQRTYQQYQATQLVRDQEVNLKLEGLPVPATASAPSALNTGNIWLIVGVIVALAVLCVTWYLYTVTRRQTQLVRKNAKGKSVTRARKQTGVEAKSDAKTKANADIEAGSEEITSERQQALLQELLTLDKAFEAGKLKKKVYQERRAKTKALLRSVMSEQEAVRP